MNARICYQGIAMTDMNTYLKLMVERSASDLFLTTGAPPCIKVDGEIFALNVPKLVVGEVKEIAERIMTAEQRKQFASTMECNFSWSCKDLGRYRINVYHQRGEVAMVMRMINSQIADFEALGLPAKVAELAMLKRGLVLVVGAAGAGKSTTLAAMIKYRSTHAEGHILTIEDPIEFLFPHARSMVDQREVGIDTLTFGEALRNALREAPDVIMLGEIRDRETAQHAITYAETGHLCISTMHANNANQAIDRLINFFPEEAHKQILLDLSMNLKGVVSQRLVPAIKQKRVLALEVLLQTSFISELMQRGRLSEIKDAMSKGNEEGIITFDQSLFALYLAGKISAETAIQNADSSTDLSLRIRLSERHSSSDAPAFTIDAMDNQKF
ncbi:PilT/PilU family type 4a pilus ATPase [Undibacterium sp.]|uniref:PilT/PilU family type 4a pilus ATPase n=1 Tax=Undibacterium sp. TaxID=1914977 RepID=UPI0025F003A0|nr:PilT/PilU family type 4a pilus ATPase [Undibacterium sp.]